MLFTNFFTHLWTYTQGPKAVYPHLNEEQKEVHINSITGTGQQLIIKSQYGQVITEELCDQIATTIG